MPPPLYASTTLAGKPWSRWSAELLGRWSSWVSMRAFGHRWSTTVLVLRRCIETTGIGACTAEGLAPTRPRSRRMPPRRIVTSGRSGKHRTLLALRSRDHAPDGQSVSHYASRISSCSSSSSPSLALTHLPLPQNRPVFPSPPRLPTPPTPPSTGCPARCAPPKAQACFPDVEAAFYCHALGRASLPFMGSAERVGKQA